MTPIIKNGIPKSIYTDAILKSKRKYFKIILRMNALNNFGGKPNNARVTDSEDFSSPYLAFIGISWITASALYNSISIEDSKKYLLWILLVFIVLSISLLIATNPLLGSKIFQ